MLPPDDLSDALARLVALAQAPDVNIRPVLLRVVVDLFAGKPHHAPADLAQFEAIVSHLLDEASVATRATVAGKLASHPRTPRGLIQRLAADEPEVAAPVFSAAALDEAALHAAASAGPAALAMAVARRADLDAAVVAALAARPESEVVLALAANPAVSLDRAILQELVRRARQEPALAPWLVGRPVADPLDLAPLFPVAGPAQRQAIMEATRRFDLGRRAWGRPDGATPEQLQRLDQRLLAGGREGFEEMLGAVLGLDSDAAGVLAADEGGEVLALALAAAGASTDLAARAFILGDPRIGLSLERVRNLVAIVAGTSAQAARRLLVAMGGSPAGARRSASAPGRTLYGQRRVAEPAEAALPRREPAAIPARRIM